MPARSPLEAELHQLALRFVDDVLSAVRRARGNRALERPLEPRERIRRPPDQIESLAQQVVAVVAAEPGLSIGAIGHRLGSSSRDLVRPIAWLVERGELTRAGERRGSRYFPARRARKKARR